MFRKRDPEVLVVGAGPVGLFSALSLAERSIAVEVVDESPSTASHSYALALHPRSLALLSELGLDPMSLRDGLRVDTVAFYDGKDRKAALQLADLSVDFPYVLVLRQSHLEDALEAALKKHKTKVKWLHRFSDWSEQNGELESEIDRLDKVTTGYPIASMETQVVQRIHRRSQFIVGADGHRSLVRRRLGSEYEAVGAPQTFGVFEFECEPSWDGEVRIVLTDDTTNVLWPLPNGRCRWSFELDDPPEELEDLHYKSWLLVQSGRDFFPHLDRKLLCRLLEQRAPWFQSTPGDIFWSAMVRFESRLATDFGRERVWLAGDAAHMTGPVGVQSMNVGLREGYELARRIAEMHLDDTPPSALTSYGNDFRGEWLRLLERSERVEAGPAADPWVAENRARILRCIPASGRDLEPLLGQIGLSFASREMAGSGGG